MEFVKNNFNGTILLMDEEEFHLSAVLAFIILGCSGVWFLFFRPFDLKKNYDELGYGAVIGRNNHKRKNLVDLGLKRRKRGDMPPPYPNTWYAVLESGDLLCGQVRAVYVLGRNLVAWRGKRSGRVFVSDAYCPHLGAHLGVGGAVIGDCIQCPFHKWSFTGINGEVQHIPYASIVDRSKLQGLRMWQVIETNGFVYIWYNADGDDPIWFPETIVDISSVNWIFHGRSEFQVTCHIQEIPENGADIAHLSALHEEPAVFGEKFQFLTGIIGRVMKHKWSANWSVVKESGRGHESVVKIAHHISLFGGWINFFHVDVLVRQIGAGIVTMHFFTPFGHGVLLQSVTPLEPMFQKITHRFYSKSRFFHPFALFVLNSETIQISRDIEIWNRKCFLKQPTLVKEDQTIKQFRRWFSQFYSKGSVQNKCTDF